MSDTTEDTAGATAREAARGAAGRVLEFAEELEASGHYDLGGEALERSRGRLHRWIDEAVAVVITPALGRVTIVHADGVASSISSPDLPFLMSDPVGEAT